eukprot:m.863049 g.863049  ORF g.863049 m.863049 type:complete len:88 (-) comp23539_c0_seq8:2746-3009(-)
MTRSMPAPPCHGSVDSLVVLKRFTCMNSKNPRVDNLPSVSHKNTSASFYCETALHRESDSLVLLTYLIEFRNIRVTNTSVSSTMRQR